MSIVSKSLHDHDHWFGFAETRVKKIVQLLETYDAKILHGLIELRPHAQIYKIQSETSVDYPVSDVYYIGMRIRKDVEIKKDLIDLTGTRQRFFE